MDILVVYDVNTQTKEGRRRLRHVARACLDFGQRVQFSVFECSLQEMQLEILRSRLLDIMDRKLDSIRIYRLPGGREGKVEVYGRDKYIDFEGPLIA